VGEVAESEEKEIAEDGDKEEEESGAADGDDVSEAAAEFEPISFVEIGGEMDEEEEGWAMSAANEGKGCAISGNTWI
jgi:hypothetical protein